jgi:Holliday junction resolvase
MAGRRSRRKGKEGEYEVVKLAKSLGLDAYRVPLSGSARGVKGDVVINGKVFGVKRWKRLLPKAVKEDLARFEGVFLREDYGSWFIIVRADWLLELLKLQKEVKNAKG